MESVKVGTELPSSTHYRLERVRQLMVLGPPHSTDRANVEYVARLYNQLYFDIWERHRNGPWQTSSMTRDDFVNAMLSFQERSRKDGTPTWNLSRELLEVLFIFATKTAVRGVSGEIFPSSSH